MSPDNDIQNNDEQIILMHRRARKKHRRKTIITLSVIIALILVGVIAAVSVLRQRVTETVGSDSSSSVESAQVETGSISTVVSGSGTLADEDVNDQDMPALLETDSFYVEKGDTVSKGDLIATVANSSLLSAMAEAQALIDSYDDKLKEASDEAADETIYAAASGRVKKIYADKDDDVVTAMYENGALMLISLDGYMALDIETDVLKKGDSVTITDSDSNTYDGSVDTVLDNKATILISDKKAAYGDNVTVTKDDETIGSGNLYIHSEMAVTAYAGTVKSVKKAVNDSVSAGDTLFTLSDTKTSADYDSILKERQKAEDLLNDLVIIYKNGGICADISGEVTYINDSSDDTQTADESAAGTASGTDIGALYGLSSESETTNETDYDYTTIARISENKSMIVTIGVDESDILSLSEGQEAEVTVDSIGEDPFPGTVTSVSTEAEGGAGVTTYSADITVDKTQDMLEGMSASVDITIEGVENALIIPADALHQTSSSAYVYTEYDEESGEFSGRVDVTSGLSNGSYVEITSGLSEGDTVYYTPSEDESTMFFGMNPVMTGEDFGGGNTYEITYDLGDENMGAQGRMPGGN